MKPGEEHFFAELRPQLDEAAKIAVERSEVALAGQEFFAVVENCLRGDHARRYDTGVLQGGTLTGMAAASASSLRKIEGGETTWLLTGPIRSNEFVLTQPYDSFMHGEVLFSCAGIACRAYDDALGVLLVAVPRTSGVPEAPITMEELNTAVVMGLVSQSPDGAPTIYESVGMQASEGGGRPFHGLQLLEAAATNRFVHAELPRIQEALRP